MAHHHPSFLELLSFTSPFAHWDLITKNCWKFLRKKLKLYGHRSFSFQVQIAWNSLPSVIHQFALASFKTNLKTHLFVKSFHRSYKVNHLIDLSSGRGGRSGEGRGGERDCVFTYLRERKHYYVRVHRVTYLSIYMTVWVYVRSAWYYVWLCFVRACIMHGSMSHYGQFLA